MADIPGDSSTNATITVGGTIEGNLESTGDHDWYRIELTAYEQYTIMLTGLTLEDPYIRVRDSAGNIVFENDDISAGVIRDSRLSFTAMSSGTYYIDVGAWDEAYTGTYQLSVQPYSPPPVFSIDEVADFLANGYWGGDRHPFDLSAGRTITVNVTALTQAGQGLALAALNMWSDIIDVDFVRVTTGGQIVFDDDQEGAFADNVWADGFSTSSHVNVNVNWLNDYGTQIGGYAFQAYIHEIGHALGLGHGGYYNVSADYFSEAVYSNDGWPMTVMSYFDQRESDYFATREFSVSYVGSPMIGDVAAMQLLYGLSTTTRAGNTTYGFNSNAERAVFNADLYPNVAYTIFDSGGIDTLDYSGWTDDQLMTQLIDLTPGSFSNVGFRVGNVGIAVGTVIENAIGGNGRDVFIVNAANNRIDGGAGEDTVSYAAATAGVTVSLLLSGSQNTGGAGTDMLLNIEHLIGSSFDDVLTGASPFGDVRAGDGNDVLIAAGELGNTLYGEAGDDLFIGGPGDNVFAGGEGFDTLDYSAAAAGVYADAFGGTGDIFSSIEKIIGSAFDDRFHGSGSGEQLIGGGGNDFILGGLGKDILTGGDGADSFYDSIAGLSGDTITDFATGDRIVFLDARLSDFSFSLSGWTLTYTGGSLTLGGGVTGTLVASAAAEGGVQLTLSETPPPPTLARAKLILTEASQDFTVGGNIVVFGTTGWFEVIELIRGDIMLDASFNIGGDTVVLPGNAGTYTATLSGSFVTIAGGDISVAIPVGAAGIAVQFADSTRTLRFDGDSGQVVLGTQAVTSAEQSVAASGPPLVDAVETGPESLAKLILTEAGQDVDIGGNLTAFGTTGSGEVITVLHGTVMLDASFNIGGDTVVLPGAADSYSATLTGSFVTIAGGDVSVSIPVGLDGITVDFSDADLTLRFDPGSGQVLLGDQVISGESGSLAAELSPPKDAETDAQSSAVAFDSFEPSTASVESFHFG